MTPFHECPAVGPSAELARAMQGLVPDLETERLILRAPRIEDFQDYARIVLGPQGKTWGKPADREEAWSGFLQLTATWYLRGHGAWVLTLRDTGAVIGLSQISPEPGDLEYELGWLLAEDHVGQGYAIEAAQAIRAHAIHTLSLPSLVSYIDADNSRSIAVAKRLSAALDPMAGDVLPDGTLVYRHHPTLATEEQP